MQSYLGIVWMVQLLQENVRTCDNVSDENRQSILSMYCSTIGVRARLREHIPMKIRRKVKVWIKERCITSFTINAKRSGGEGDERARRGE